MDNPAVTRERSVSQPARVIKPSTASSAAKASQEEAAAAAPRDGVLRKLVTGTWVFAARPACSRSTRAGLMSKRKGQEQDKEVHQLR
jgi:hypothetical protein